MKEKTSDIDILEEIKNKFNKTMKILALGEHSTFVDNSFFDDFGKLINISETLIAENKELKEENKCLKNKELDYMTVYLNGVYDGEKKVKDKIKAKIEELEAMSISQEIYYEDILKILQSLLEKE